MQGSTSSQLGTETRDKGPFELRGLTVLIVEDDAPSAKLLVVVLRREGCITHVARSAEEALAVLPAVRPAAIVLDMVLPLMSGVLLTQRLKADPMTRDIVVVAVSAFDGAQLEQVARQAGCADYVKKPIDPLSFADVLATALGSKR